MVETLNKDILIHRGEFPEWYHYMWEADRPGFYFVEDTTYINDAPEDHDEGYLLNIPNGMITIQTFLGIRKGCYYRLLYGEKKPPSPWIHYPKEAAT